MVGSESIGMQPLTMKLCILITLKSRMNQSWLVQR